MSREPASADHRRSLVASLLPDCVAIVEGPIQGVPDLLWPEEADFIANAVEKRRLEFACGRHFARRALRALGVPDGPLLADVDRMPRWPGGFTGSITHTNHYCAVAVARNTEVAAIGIDVEEMSRVLGPDLIPYILSPQEIAASLQGIAPEQQHRRAVALFSAKEAFYKCLYGLTRTRLAFHDVAVEFDGSSDIFHASLLVPAGKFGVGHSFTGRYAFDRDRVATAILLSPLSSDPSALATPATPVVAE